MDARCIIDSMKSRAYRKNHVTGIVIAAMVGAVVLVTVMVLRRPAATVNNFEQCRLAGGALMESYPEQCHINGKTFVNDAQLLDGSQYMGLTEKAALVKAEQATVPARVVEREGESLPVTMDFVFGRHNLYIKDGKVYNVEIEGQAMDTGDG